MGPWGVRLLWFGGYTVACAADVAEVVGGRWALMAWLVASAVVLEFAVIPRVVKT